MNNTLLQFKLEQRINKISSFDSSNIEPSAKIEAFNKAMDEWTYRQLEGIDQVKTGAEGSIRKIDQLQCILTTWTGNFTNKGLYWQSDLFPPDYLEWCRLDFYGKGKCDDCPSRLFTTFLGNEADAVIDLRDVNKQPNYEWATTFHTIMGNTFKIWTNKQFDVVNPLLTYYRKPVHIQIVGATNPDTGTVSIVEVECEFPDIVTELIIADTAAILSGDLNELQKQATLRQSAEMNN